MKQKILQPRLLNFCVLLQVAEARLIAVNSADYVDSSSLLNVPPYYSYMGYDRPASLDDLHYQQLLAIADQYNLKLSDLYQLYDLSRTSLPSATPHDYVNIIQQVAEAVQLERMRRGLAPSSHLVSVCRSISTLLCTNRTLKIKCEITGILHPSCRPNHGEYTVNFLRTLPGIFL